MENFLGVGFSLKDMQRITHCVGSMALAVLLNAKDEDEIEEAKALHEIHSKLIDALDDALKIVKKAESDEA